MNKLVVGLMIFTILIAGAFMLFDVNNIEKITAKTSSLEYVNPIKCVDYVNTKGSCIEGK